KDLFDLRKALLPQRPVRVGDTWKVDTRPMIEDLGKSMTVDADKATATGKLTDTRLENGARFGKMNFHIELPLKEFVSPKDTMPAEPGGRMGMDISMDGWIDGRQNPGAFKTSVRMTGTGLLKQPEGKPIKVMFSSRTEAQERRTELPGGR